MKSIHSTREMPTTVYPSPVAVPAVSDPMPRSVSASTPAPRCHLAFDAAGAQHTGGELATLLRSRLRIATLIVLAPFVYYFFKHWVDPAPEFAGGVFVKWAHISFIVLTVAAVALVWSKVPLSLKQLRAVEVFLFGMTAAFFAILQYFIFCIEKVCLASADTPEMTRLAIGSSGVRWFFLIVTYGVFIPNTWHRCARACIIAAVLPIALTAIGALAHGRFDAGVVSALSDMTILMGIAVSVAIFGSYRIQLLQQAAHEARQLGQYRLKQRLGAGGMGEVYLAEHLLLRRPCAVKLIRPEHAHDRRSLQRFEREVRAMATLTHWNTVEIFDFGHADDGTFYYVMEYLPGRTLDDLVSEFGPLPPARAVHFLRQICYALREAHGIGLLHRDIKPGNVLACTRGGVHDVAKLLDFGLVQDATIDQDADRLTLVGSIVGSPPFMSPEQASGKPADSRSDIYSVGTLGFYLVTGQPPFPRDTPMQMIMAHAYEQVPPMASIHAGVPSDLEAVLLRCLAKDPAGRWPDAISLERALAACECAGEWTDERAEAWWKEVGGEPADLPRQATPATPVMASPVPAN